MIRHNYKKNAPVLCSKDVDTITGAEHYQYWVHCITCGDILPIPETLYAWYMRVTNGSPSGLMCDKCSRDEPRVSQTNPDIFPNAYWIKDNALKSEVCSHIGFRYEDEASVLRHGTGVSSERSSDASYYSYQSPFYKALTHLKTFIERSSDAS